MSVAILSENIKKYADIQMSKGQSVKERLAAKSAGSALQNPDVSRMTLDAILRRGKQLKAQTEKTSRSWTHMIDHCRSSNANCNDTAV